jgi:sigma-B regulation protein RsbU (phosphoserine phosphatase)
MSIRTRLILAFTICLCLACASIATLAFTLTKSSADESFQALATSQLERVEERINTFLEPGVMSVKYLSGLDLVRESKGRLTSYLETTETTTLFYENYTPYEQRIYDEFIRVHNTNANFGLVFMSNADGQFTQAPEGHILFSGYDPRQRPWYLEAMADPADVTVTSPYLTTDGGMACSIVSKTYDPSGKFLGLLVVDYSLQSITSDLSERRILETGYLVVFDTNGQIIADGRHPEFLALAPEEYPELRKHMASSGDGVLNYRDDEDGEQFVVIHQTVSPDWTLAVVFDNEEVMASSYAVLRTILSTSALAFIVALFVVIMLARSIVRPLEELIEAATIISSGEYDASEKVRLSLRQKLSVTGQGESKRLSESLQTMLTVMQERMEAEKERIGAELRVATKIQASMLPSIFPAFPEKEEFDIFATMAPAKEVGGDFYDFYMVDENKLCLVIADVSGKGVPAALFMVITKTIIKNNAFLGKSPKEIFDAVNVQLCENNSENMFVTAFMGIYELDSGKFTYVNAGHNLPLVKKTGGNFEWLKSKSCFVLAGLDTIKYVEQEITLHEGDEIYFYTDGVTEALNLKDELFSDARLLDKLNEHKDLPLPELLDKIRAEIDQFADGAEQADDITMMAFKIKLGAK